MNLVFQHLFFIASQADSIFRLSTWMASVLNCQCNCVETHVHPVWLSANLKTTSLEEYMCWIIVWNFERTAWNHGLNEERGIGTTFDPSLLKWKEKRITRSGHWHLKITLLYSKRWLLGSDFLSHLFRFERLNLDENGSANISTKRREASPMPKYHLGTPFISFWLHLKVWDLIGHVLQ